MAQESPEEVPAGLHLRHFLDGHDAQVTDVSWSPNGQFLATASYDQTIRLWEPDSGSLVKTLAGHDDWVSRISWEAGGSRFVTGSGDRTIRIWRAGKGKLEETFQAFGGEIFEPAAVFGVAWSPDGLTIAAGESRGLVELWDARSGQLLRTLEDHARDVNTVAWSPDGQLLASGSDDGTIRLWDARSGVVQNVLRGHSEFVHCLVWQHNGDYLASSAWDNTIRIWDPATGRQRHVLEGHRQAVHYFSLSADGRLLASKSDDSTVRIWRTDTWQTVAILPEPKASGNVGIAFHPQLPILATLGPKSIGVRVWDVDIDVLLASAPDRRPPQTDIDDIPSAPAELKTKGFRTWAGGTMATLSIVYTDIVGSTKLNIELGNAGMEDVRAAHFGRARELVDRLEGFTLKTMGDAFMVTFRTAIEALDFALALHEDTGHARVAIRAGIHVGLMRIEEEDAFGSAVSFGKRVESKADGPEIWLSESAHQQIREQQAEAHESLRWQEHAGVELKGFPGTYTLWELKL